MKRIKSKKITQSARGKDCTLRIPNVCKGNPKTTVGAHINGAGMAYKAHDPLIAYACHECHAWVDGGYKDMDLTYVTERDIRRAIRDSEQLRGINETFPQLYEQGLVKV